MFLFKSKKSLIHNGIKLDWYWMKYVGHEIKLRIWLVTRPTETINRLFH